MNRFSASDAALEGFRLTREHAPTMLVWAVMYLFGVTTVGALMLLSLGKPLIEYIKQGGLNSFDPDKLAVVLAQSWPAFLGILVVVVLFLSVLTAGIFRLVLRPGERGFMHLRLGPDELRLTAVNFLLLPLGLLSAAIVDLVGNVVASQSGVLAGLFAAAVVASPMIWVGVRLSLATPVAFAEHRISIRHAWALSRGRFWPLLGMIVLAVIFYVIVWALILIICAVLAQLGGGASTSLGAPGAKFTVVGVVVLLLTLFFQMMLPIIQWVTIYAPFAVAYQQLHGDAPANPLRVRTEHG